MHRKSIRLDPYFLNLLRVGRSLWECFSRSCPSLRLFFPDRTVSLPLLSHFASYPVGGIHPFLSFVSIAFTQGAWELCIYGLRELEKGFGAWFCTITRCALEVWVGLDWTLAALSAWSVFHWRHRRRGMVWSLPRRNSAHLVVVASSNVYSCLAWQMSMG